MQIASLAALDDVLRAGDRRRDDMDLGLKADPHHPEWLFDPILFVDDVLLRQHVKNFPVGGRFGNSRRKPARLNLSMLLR